MADDVCESWEDLIKDSPTDETVQFNTTNKSNEKVDNHNRFTVKKKSADSICALNTNLVTPKILNRNAIDNSPAAANSSKNIQITFEDSNARNQFMIQQNKVKILQRPKDQHKNDNVNMMKNGLYNAKTIQEREAEYAKARLRILGADYSNDDESLTGQTNSQQSSQIDSGLVRAAQGPSNSNFLPRR